LYKFSDSIARRLPYVNLVLSLRNPHSFSLTKELSDEDSDEHFARSSLTLCSNRVQPVGGNDGEDRKTIAFEENLAGGSRGPNSETTCPRWNSGYAQDEAASLASAGVVSS